MHRLPVETSALESCAACGAGRAAAAHLRAIRPKNGEQIELFDGAGRTRLCTWRDGALEPSGGVVEHPPRPGAPTTLFACISKGQRWDWTLAKATELGVSRIVPVLSERTIVRIDESGRAAKRERWMRVAEDAARQSGAVWLPRIDEATPFGEALALARGTVCFAGIIADPPPPPLLAEVQRLSGCGRPLSLFVGPEGDFSPEEREALAAIATPCSFGSTILRTETAAIFGLSVLAAAAAAAANTAG